MRSGATHNSLKTALRSVILKNRRKIMVIRLKECMRPVANLWSKRASQKNRRRDYPKSEEFTARNSRMKQFRGRGVKTLLSACLDKVRLVNVLTPFGIYITYCHRGEQGLHGGPARHVCRAVRRAMVQPSTDWGPDHVDVGIIPFQSAMI
jgi:hypothetical protein